MLSPAAADKVSGIVTDTSRAPVAGATVQLIENKMLYYLEEQIKPLVETTSGSDGKFQVDCPSTGTVAFLVWAPKFRRAKFPVNVAAYADRMVGIALQPGNDISGKVVGTDGKPIAGAVLGPLSPGNEVERALAAKAIPQWTRTNSDGTFAFTSVAPGMGYHFLVRAPGHQMADVEAKPGATNINVKLRTGGSYVPGVLISKRDPPSSFRGTPIRLNGNGFDEFIAADGNGRFEFRGLPRGSFSVEPLLGYDRGVRVATITTPDDEGTTIELKISDGYYIRGHAIDIATSGPVIGLDMKVSDVATSTGPEGNFAAGPLLNLTPLSVEIAPETGYRLLNPPQDNPDSPVPNGFDDVEGIELQVEKLRTLHIDLDGFDQTTRSVTIHVVGPRGEIRRAPTTTDTVTLQLTGTDVYAVYAESGAIASQVEDVPFTEQPVKVELILGPAAIAYGKAIQESDPETTTPKLCRVRIEAPTASGRQFTLLETACAESGDFLFPVLPFGQSVVGVRNPSGTRETSLSVTLRPGRNGPFEFSFPAGKTLAGNVQDQKAVKVPAAMVEYSYVDSSGALTTRTVEADEAGKFRVEDIDAEQLKSISVATFGYAPFSVADVVLPQKSYTITLNKAPAARAMVVADKTSSWKIQVLETTFSSDGILESQLTSQPIFDTEAKGNEIVDLELPGHGRYRVIALGANKEVAVSEPFDWKPSRSAEARVLQLHPGAAGKVRGRIEGYSGEPAEVVATNMTLPGEMETEFKTVASNSEFTFDKLPPGDYLILVTTPDFFGKATNIEVNASGEVMVTIMQSQGN